MKTTGFGSGGGIPGDFGFASESELAARRAKTGLQILLAVITSLFSLFILAFLLRSQYADWQPLSGEWQPLFEPGLLWVNTVMLIFGSIALQWARVSVRRDNPGGVITGFILGGVFAVLFLIGQLGVWHQLIGWGYVVASNPANSFFYLLTGLHGLHLLGGLVAWMRTAVKLWNGRPLPELAMSVELCAIYWHYLLVVWLVLFGLLMSTPETYRAIAAFCGF